MGAQTGIPVSKSPWIRRWEIQVIVKDLYEVLKVRLEPIIEDPLFQAMAIFLDTESYGLMECNEILDSVQVIIERFRQLLVANGCNLSYIPSEIEVLYEHTKRFLQAKPAHKTWPHLFTRHHQLGISNVIHIAEISIAIPASNAETERVFSFLWRVFSKDRQSFKNESLENVLRLRCDRDFSEGRYEHAVEMFLTEHPNGEIRKQPRRVDGHAYPNQRKRLRIEKPSIVSLLDEIASSDDEENAENTIEDIDADQISSDEWTSSDTDLED